MKVAIVHDWLTNMGGAEPVVLKLHEIFPNAPIYTSVYDKEKMTAFAGCDVRTTYLQRWLPSFLRYKHVLWPVLRAHAFRMLDLSEYDLIISSSSAEAKSVRKRSGAIHICYCHTPIRYYWSHYDDFRRDFNFGPLTFAIRPFIPLFVRWMRKKDLESIKGVDHFIANSHETQARIKEYYGRESTVIFPPVDIERFMNKPADATEREGFLMWSRHVPYKRFDLAIEACNRLKLPLTIAGTGPETERLKKLAGPTITFVGRVSDEEIVRLAHSHKAFLFPGEEDFGITPVEAMAAGLPVIAYGKGGALDYVIPNKTGILFKEQTADSLIAAIKEFETKTFDPKTIQASTEKFSPERFVKEIQQFVTNKAK
ncbi:MAG: glycosyltransferase [Candidatus Saccharimonadales bacterium]